MVALCPADVCGYSAVPEPRQSGLQALALRPRIIRAMTMVQEWLEVESLDLDAQGVAHRVDGEGASGRSEADAPEIDGEVHLRDAGHLVPGDIVPALIEDADEHDLYAVPVRSRQGR